MEFKDKRLLILGGAIQCKKVVLAAQEMGVHTIVTDMSAHPEVRAIADECLSYSVLDVEGLYQWCLQHPVDGVLNYNVDPAQNTHQKLCEKLGFPSYGTAEQYHTLTDKAAFKRFCKTCGIDVLQTFDQDDLETIEYPVLVKPAECSGSRGQILCNNREELEEALQKAQKTSRNGRATIEKNMQGKQDFTISFVIKDGEPFLIRTGDRYLGRKEDNLQRQCMCTIAPSLYQDFYLEKVHGRFTAMLKQLGLKNALTFFQGFIDGDTVRFYDPGIRFPGGEFDLLYEKVTGISVAKAMVAYALSGQIPLNGSELANGYLLNGKDAVQLTVSARPGEIGTYEGFEEIEKIPGLYCVARKSKVGAVIPASGDLKQRIAEFAFVADNREEVYMKAQKVYASLKVLDKEGNDMIVSKIV